MKRVFAKKKWVNLIILFIMLLVVFSGCGKRGNTATVTVRTGSAVKDETESTTDVEVTENAAANEDLYIVEDLDMESETISLYSISGARQLRYNYTMTTKFLDKFGDNASWASFTSGTVVTLGDKLPSSGALGEVRKAESVWVYDDLSKYKIDSENGIFTIGDSNYKINSSTKAYSDGERILLSSITDSDVLTVIGKDKDILSVSVTTGHGYVHLSNTGLFDNSLMFIGNKIVTMVYGDATLEIPEGTYDITVANDGWGGTAQYTVVRNEITEVNLDELKGEGPSYCDLTFLVTVPDTQVYIDGQLIDTNEVNSVRYGSHKLNVVCEGYTSWNKTLVVNSKSATITLELETEQKTTDTTTSDNQEESTDNSAETTQKIVDTINQTSNEKDDYDYEKDYLSTISDMLSSLMN